MKIFHFTRIENLELILKNKTLRFNNAKNVDDPEEAETDDYGSLKDYFFISCWSKSFEKSSALWEMYANSGRGVCLEVDTKYIHYNGNEIDGINIVVENVIKKNENSFFINYWHNSRSNGATQYFEMKYSDESKRLEEKISDICSHFTFEKAFNTKSKCWAFQEEVRFFLLGCSIDDSTICADWQLIFNNIRAKKEFSADHVDLTLDDDFFDNLTIRCGPLSSEADKMLIESLVQAFNKGNKIMIKKIVLSN